MPGKKAGRNRQFEFQQFLRRDVMRLVIAHEIGRSLHRGGNIRAAREEVEAEVRTLLRRRLPGAYYVGQGHLVDTGLRQSPQCDVVIADRTDGQVLMAGGGETEYFPYEAVYAIGEVKSSYEKSHLPAMAERLRQIRQKLEREKQYPSTGEADFLRTRSNAEPYLNPLFSFLLVVDSTGFEVADVTSLYASTPLEFLPSVVCLLDRGNILHTSWGREPGNFRPNPQAEMLQVPHFNSTEALFWPTRDWRLLPHRDAATRYETNFAAFYFHLFAYLRTCVLEPAPLDRYLRHLFAFDPPQKVADVCANEPLPVAPGGDRSA